MQMPEKTPKATRCEQPSSAKLRAAINRAMQPKRLQRQTAFVVSEQTPSGQTTGTNFATHATDQAQIGDANNL